MGIGHNMVEEKEPMNLTEELRCDAHIVATERKINITDTASWRGAEHIHELESKLEDNSYISDSPPDSTTLPVVLDTIRHNLPTPRLQLTWMRVNEHKWFCRYDLIMGIPDIDSRGNDMYERNGKRILPIKMGGTMREASRDPEIDQILDMPFRDGAHIQWDCESLKLPGFVVWGRYG